jgi:hypothetical protein
MAELQEQPSQVLDDFDLDLVVKVLSLSLWSPAFAMWVPVITMSQASFFSPQQPLQRLFQSNPVRCFEQGFAWGTPELFWTTFYFIACTLFWIVRWSDSVWRNQSWKDGLRGLFGQRRVDWGEEIVLVTGGPGRGLFAVVVIIADVDHTPRRFWPRQSDSGDIGHAKRLGRSAGSQRF